MCMEGRVHYLETLCSPIDQTVVAVQFKQSG